MKSKTWRSRENRCEMSETTISRRCLMGTSSLSLMGLLTALGLSRVPRKAFGAERRSGRSYDLRSYMQRMRDASDEERRQIQMERMAQRQREALEAFKDKLGCSDDEWAVVGVKLEAVYYLVHPKRGLDGLINTRVEQKTNELRESVRNEKAAAADIRAKLTSLRAAKEKTHQKLALAQKDLRELLTLRQEAILVLNELLA